MTKPQPRRSALASQSVIKQPTQVSRAPVQPKQATEQKITVRVNADVADEARGLFMAELAHGGPRTWSKWVEQALISHSEDVQERLKTPIAPREPGTLPTGPR